MLAGVRPSGRPKGRLVYMTNLQDTLASPLGGLINYIGGVREAWGDEAADRLRVWVMENAGHIPASSRAQGSPPVLSTRLLDWHGSVERALAALVAWTERGVEPPADTRFELDGTRVVLPARADERRGNQPVVQLTATGVAEREYAFQAVVSVPPGAGPS